MNRKFHFFGIAILLFIISACSQFRPHNMPQNVPLGWTAVFKHNKNGEVLAGDIQTLIESIRKGYNIRVGWGWKKQKDNQSYVMEHLANPIFLSIIQEQHVSVIIDAHPLLANYIKLDQQVFSDEGHYWQSVLTTTGSFNARVFHRSTGEVVKDWPQRHRMTWFVEYPGSAHSGNTSTLYD